MPARRTRPTDGRARTDVDTAVLQALDGARGPLGAREIRHALVSAGYQLSEATVSRRLRELDDARLTVPVDRKGRLLTDEGRRVLRSRLRGLEHTDLLNRVGDVRTGSDVLHLLRARRVVEPEAVHGGAGRIDSDVLARLRAAVDGHERALGDDDRIPRALVLDFHRTVTSFTANPLIAAMARIALDPSLDHVEAALDVILQARHTGHESVAEHAAIVDALATGDADAAAAAMRAHLDRLIDEATAFMDQHDASLVDRLLTG